MPAYNHYSRFLTRIYDPVLHFPVMNIRKHITNEVIKSGAGSMIDMCCGTGTQLIYLQKAGITHLMGIDISDNMLRQAHRNGVGNLCEKMDASDTTFPDGSFDAAVINFSLHEMKAEMAINVMEEAKRIVKPTGQILITDYCFDSQTRLLGKFLCIATERYMGGDHYRNFRHYISTDLMSRLTSGMKTDSEAPFLFWSVRVWVLQNS